MLHVTREPGSAVPGQSDMQMRPRPTPSPAAHSAVTALAEQHLGDVFRYVLYLTGDRAVADDLTAQTFETALHRWHRYDACRGSERTWLCQLARSATLDHLRSEERRRHRQGTYVAAMPTGEAERFSAGYSPELEAALATLSAGEREVVALRLLLDLDAAGAARVLGISRTACSMRLGRALRKLEEGMAAHAVA
jgi:RNA polymerase sigma factor (sigma-70 family)